MSDHTAMDDDELRMFATYMLNEHTPSGQGHSYNRCALCGYTRHPCDTYDLAAHVLALLDRLAKWEPR